MATSTSQRVRFVCVSDTHNAAPGEGFTLPKGDVLIHSGDLTNQGSYAELKKAVEWIVKADFKVKIVVAGNHDLSLDAEYRLKHEEGWRVESDSDFKACKALFEDQSDIIYLQHSRTTIQIPETKLTLRVFGSPYSPDRSRQNWAFQYPEEAAGTIWSGIPDDTDVLITHTPPQGHCDASAHWTEGGCPKLSQAVTRVRPVLHVCGHCHEGRGAEVIDWGEVATDQHFGHVTKWSDPGVGNKKQSLLRLADTHDKTAVVNASITAKSWGRGAKAFNKPVVVDVEFPVRSGDDD